MEITMKVRDVIKKIEADGWYLLNSKMTDRFLISKPKTSSLPKSKMNKHWSYMERMGWIILH